jgi:hypothetical protein
MTAQDPEAVAWLEEQAHYYGLSFRLFMCSPIGSVAPPEPTYLAVCRPNEHERRPAPPRPE